MEETKLKAKKSLGQHFLRSEKALNQIVENIDIENRDTTCVFEIGPGEGVLTRRILDAGYTVFAIEIDPDAIVYLKENFREDIKNKKLFIIEKDCLTVDYKQEMGKKFSKYFLVGNIPYYITGAIFRQTFEQKQLPTGAIFLIQKEVGQRIVAHDKKESILSISVKIFGQASVIDIVKAGSFSPPPKVDSIIIKVKDIRSPFKNEKHYEKFFAILRSAFHHKRKFALSNIKNELGEETKLEMQKFIKEKERAEDLSVLNWIEILGDLK